MSGRDCYCRDGQTTCGTCEACGAPGHTRHYPGARPYTGSWCDRCYAREAGGGLAGLVGSAVGWFVVLTALLWPLWNAWLRHR